MHLIRRAKTYELSKLTGLYNFSKCFMSLNKDKNIQLTTFERRKGNVEGVEGVVSWSVKNGISLSIEM